MVNKKDDVELDPVKVKALLKPKSGLTLKYFVSLWNRKPKKGKKKPAI